MTARTGKPISIGLWLGGVAGAEYEIQEPVPGTLLVCCGACGFTWDADHTVHDDSDPTRVGYECPVCINRLFVEARQKAVEEAVIAGVQQLAANLRADHAKLMAEVNERLAGIALRGWWCTACSTFNGSEHSVRTDCRRCGRAKGLASP